MKYADYHRALERLQSALYKDPDVDGIYIDASMHRFELSFYLAWNLMKVVLEYEGIEVDSPRSSICEAGKQGMIADTKMWFEMQKKRNLSSHTYNQASALDVYQLIREKYAPLLLALDKEVQRRLEVDQSN
ncbi:HI0074 family nucleotidyltransferase substrate-binding subunit [Selenomonas ruminantium]|nr:HI0074 family nucleotidyltransferase substrate-binding subunit [Selenomonas ruminantium]